MGRPTHSRSPRRVRTRMIAPCTARRCAASSLSASKCAWVPGSRAGFGGRRSSLEGAMGCNVEGSVCHVSAGDRVGELLAGRYRVLRRLGAGGMGTVYLAEHVHLGRLTAVKVLCPPLCEDDPSSEQRFRQEALLVAKVRHPSVAQVYDFDRLPDGRYLLAMEYVPGETVAQQLERDGPFLVPEAIRGLGTVADALDHVHGSEIVQGELKP